MVKNPKLSQSSESEQDSDVEIAARDQLQSNEEFTAKFGQKAINNEAKLEERLREV
jgi:hypothetical protein